MCIHGQVGLEQQLRRNYSLSAPFPFSGLLIIKTDHSLGLGSVMSPRAVQVNGEQSAIREEKSPDLWHLLLSVV